ncbi:MAG: N-acetyltransferase [Pseudomonadota bacterium]
MRLVTSNDFNDVYEIYMDKNNNPYLLHEISDQETFKPIFDGLLKRDQFYAYEIDNEVACICACDYGIARTSHVASLGTLAFKSKYHGKEYAQKFIQSIVNNLQEQGFKRIDLWVEADNPKAQKFYKKLGFKEEARIKNYYKRANYDDYVDEIVMAKLF